jgi:hypothetical protein
MGESVFFPLSLVREKSVHHFGLNSGGETALNRMFGRMSFRAAALVAPIIMCLFAVYSTGLA